MGWSVFSFLISFVRVCGMECIFISNIICDSVWDGVCVSGIESRRGGGGVRVSRFVLLTSQHQLSSYRDGTFVHEITRETGGVRNRIDKPRFKRQAAYMLHC